MNSELSHFHYISGYHTHMLHLRFTVNCISRKPSMHGNQWMAIATYHSLTAHKGEVPMLVLNHLLESSIKSSTLSHTNSLDWFRPTFIYIVDIVVGHPQQALLWWKIVAARSFILNRGIVTTPGSLQSTKAIVASLYTRSPL